MNKQQEDIEIKIRKFDPRKMKPYCVCLFIGKRNTGKSFLIKDILYHHKDKYPAGKIISGTDHLNHFYDRFVPGMLIDREYNPSILNKLFVRQEKAINEGWSHPGAFLVMDDCLSNKSWQKDQHIRRVFLEGRHSRLMFFMATQFPLGVPPDLRMNIDYIFILRNNILKERRKIYENYCGMMDYETFDKLMQACTDNHGCLVVDAVTPSNKLEDQIFYYKAEPHDGVRLCHEQFWRENETNYTKSKEQQQNQSAMLNKKRYSTKNGRNITIYKKD